MRLKKLSESNFSVRGVAGWLIPVQVAYMPIDPLQPAELSPWCQTFLRRASPKKLVAVEAVMVPPSRMQDVW